MSESRKSKHEARVWRLVNHLWWAGHVVIRHTEDKVAVLKLAHTNVANGAGVTDIAQAMEWSEGVTRRTLRHPWFTKVTSPQETADLYRYYVSLVAQESRNQLLWNADNDPPAGAWGGYWPAKTQPGSWWEEASRIEGGCPL